jgi:hypothetical protein
MPLSRPLTPPVVLFSDVFPSLWPELEPEALSSGPRTPIFARPFLIRASHAGGNLPVVRKPRNTSPHGYPSPLPPKFVTMSLNWADYGANGITWDEAHSFKYTTSLCLLLSLDIIFALLLFDIK